MTHDVVRLRRTPGCWMFGVGELTAYAWFLAVLMGIVTASASLSRSTAQQPGSLPFVLIALVMAAVAAIICAGSGPRIEGSILRFGLFARRRLDLGTVIGIATEDVQTLRIPTKAILVGLENRKRVFFSTSSCVRSTRREEWIDQLAARAESVRPACSAPILRSKSDWPPLLGVFESWDQRNQRWTRRKLNGSVSCNGDTGVDRIGVPGLHGHPG